MLIFGGEGSAHGGLRASSDEQCAVNPGLEQGYIGDYNPQLYIKGQLRVPLTVYPWYLLYSLGILGYYNRA